MKMLQAVSAFSALLVGAGVSPAASAAIVAPTSYSMQNGQSGTYTYHDDTYSGTGSSGVDGAPLSGGLGKLTDGIIASAHWWPNGSAPFVGWWTISPTIVFRFADNIAFDSATFYFDNTSENVFGGVVAPATWTATDGSHTATYTSSTSDFSRISPALAETLNLSGFTGNTLAISLNQVPGRFVMLSEVSFSGTAIAATVPEPSTWMMMLVGLGLVGSMLRRREKVQVVDRQIAVA